MYVQSGECGKCGSPQWVPSVWFGISPPPIYWSCDCYLDQRKVSTVGEVTHVLKPDTDSYVDKNKK